MKKLIMFILFLLSVSLVSSYMPETHTIMNSQTILSSPNSDYSQIVQEYYSDFIACNVLSDISVFYYFSEGFSKIGTKYKQTHSQNLCERMIANAENDRQLSCAIGVCTHEVQDSVSHNDFVPEVIRRTYLVNGLVHIFAEEKVNDILKTKESSAQIRQALSDVAPIHKEFFRKSLVFPGSDFPFDSMYDAFVGEVVGNQKYSVGFRGFFAVPLQIHLILISLFIMALVILAYLIRAENKNIFNITSMVLLMIIVILVILVYGLFFAGKLWLFFQWASHPVSQIMPTQGYEQWVQKSITQSTFLFNNGATATMAIIPDPAGENALLKAGEAGQTFRIVVDLILLSIIALFVWLNIRRR